MALPPLTVELTSPQSVDGRPAPYQSLWLLVRLHRARLDGAPLRLDDLRGQVSSAATLRMVVSRAFRDFKAWGVAVGWGADASRDPRFLNAEGRSQGPFWLPPAQAARREHTDAAAAESGAYHRLPDRSGTAHPGPDAG